MKTHSLALHGSYKHLSLALCKEGGVVAKISEDNFRTSAHLIPRIDTLLSSHALTLHDISYIALDTGPGAFTSLRSIIVTCNALSFASGIPLISVDGLDALSQQALQKLRVNKPTLLIALLNAYNNDVFYAISTIDYSGTHPHRVLCEEKSYCNVDRLLEKVKSSYGKHQTYFCGNGADLHREKILQVLSAHALIESDAPLTASAEQVATLGHEYFVAGVNISHKVLPQYLKTQQFKTKY